MLKNRKTARMHRQKEAIIDFDRDEEFGRVTSMTIELQEENNQLKERIKLLRQAMLIKSPLKETSSLEFIQ